MEAAARVREAIEGAVQGLVDREAVVELIALAAVAREHVLLIGPHVDRGAGSVWIDDVYVRPAPVPGTPNQIVNVISSLRSIGKASFSCSRNFPGVRTDSSPALTRERT